MDISLAKDLPLVSVQGEIDHWAAPELEQKINEIIDQGHSSIILDFSDLTYIDSGGVAVLFLELQKLQAKNGQLIVISDNHNIIKILTLVKIDAQKKFNLCSTLEEAKKLLG